MIALVVTVSMVTHGLGAGLPRGVVQDRSLFDSLAAVHRCEKPPVPLMHAPAWMSPRVRCALVVEAMQVAGSEAQPSSQVKIVEWTVGSTATPASPYWTVEFSFHPEGANRRVVVYFRSQTAPSVRVFG